MLLGEAHHLDAPPVTETRISDTTPIATADPIRMVSACFDDQCGATVTSAPASTVRKAEA
jgi:hypothetical protein